MCFSLCSTKGNDSEAYLSISLERFVKSKGLSKGTLINFENSRQNRSLPTRWRSLWQLRNQNTHLDMAEMLLHLSADVDDLPFGGDDEKESSAADQMLRDLKKRNTYSLQTAESTDRSRDDSVTEVRTSFIQVRGIVPRSSWRPSTHIDEILLQVEVIELRGKVLGRAVAECCK